MTKAALKFEEFILKYLKRKQAEQNVKSTGKQTICVRINKYFKEGIL